MDLSIFYPKPIVQELGLLSVCHSFNIKDNSQDPDGGSPVVFLISDSGTGYIFILTALHGYLLIHNRECTP